MTVNSWWFNNLCECQSVMSDHFRQWPTQLWFLPVTMSNEKHCW